MLRAQSRLGRTGAELPRAGRGAAAVAVLRLLPAHSWGRHLHRPVPAAARAPPSRTLPGSRVNGALTAKCRRRRLLPPRERPRGLLSAAVPTNRAGLRPQPLGAAAPRSSSLASLVSPSSGAAKPTRAAGSRRPRRRQRAVYAARRPRHCPAPPRPA